jgi:hypothetical protein
MLLLLAKKLSPEARETCPHPHKFMGRTCFRIAVTLSVAAIRKQRMSFDGGADRDRTGDPLLAKQVLSQLSYSPTN